MTKGDKSLVNNLQKIKGPYPTNSHRWSRVLEYLEGIRNQMFEINTRMSKVEKNSVRMLSGRRDGSNFLNTVGKAQKQLINDLIILDEMGKKKEASLKWDEVPPIQVKLDSQISGGSGP